jgi:heavy metal sensor kinase
MGLSIRWRLTLWNTVALAVLLLGFGTLVYVLLARLHYQQLDRMLLGELQLLRQDSRLPTASSERLRYWIAEFKEHENVCCVVYDPDGNPADRTEELAADSVPPRPRAATPEPEFTNTTLPIIGRQRVLTTRLPLDHDYTIVLLASLADLDSEMDQLLTVLLTAGPVVLVLSGAAGYLLARKALAPMGQLYVLTEKISADHLDRRLPVTNPHDEVGRLATTINRMIARLEGSFAEIRRFTADASHELRTPLTAIRIETEAALARSLSPDESRTLLYSILEECERLTRLTEQLLGLAREDARKERHDFEPVALDALLGRVVETMRPVAEARGLKLTCGELPRCSVTGDENRLRQVFFNLLDNAIKYTPAGGRVEVNLEDNHSISARVVVRDTGIGITAEHLPHIFERFYRVDKARSRELGGSGLGLSIVYSIIKSHAGAIDLTSKPGEGTTVSVILKKIVSRE